MSYMTISSQEKHNFSLCSCFHAHPTTLLLKILGGTNTWAVPPPQILGGTVPPRSPPLCVCIYACMYICKLCMYVFMHVCMHVCIYLCLYVCMHVCRYSCIYALR